MKARSTTPEPTCQDQRPLVLLVIGLLISLWTLIEWSPGLPSFHHRGAAAEEGDRYLWLSGGTIGEGLYRLPQSVTMNRLYSLAGLTPPTGGLAAAVPGCASLTLRDQAQPVSAPMANAVRPLFFQAISVNLADRELLTTVPGIGPALADRIVRQREERGGFARPEELLKVRGIGPRKLAKFKPFLQFDN